MSRAEGARVEGRVLDRIEYLVGEADYPDSASAVDDAWRVALIAQSRSAERARQAVRDAAAATVNARRRPDGKTPRRATRAHRIAFVAALVLAALAVGLIAVSPRTGGTFLALEQGAVLAGVLALVSIGGLAWLEPLRADGSLWGSHAPAAFFLVLAAVWLLFAASVPLFRADEIDAHEPAPVVIGLVMFALAGIAAIVLWWRARTSDRTRSQTGVAHTTRDVAGGADADEVLTALDAWWAQAGPAAVARDAAGLERVHDAVLAHLRATMLITDRDARSARRVGSVDWKERRR